MIDIAPVGPPPPRGLRDGRVTIGLPAGFSAWMVEQITPPIPTLSGVKNYKFLNLIYRRFGASKVYSWKLTALRS
jgi:hypothetical protein